MPETIRVLLIDDDEDDYLITQDLFDDIHTTYEYQVEWANNYEYGYGLLQQQQHHIYLLDYRLGKYTGLDLLKEAVGAGLSGPFIMLTGQGEHEIDLQAMELGASDYLVKGEMTATLLERAVRYALERHRATQRIQESEARYRDLFENAFDLIQSIDHNGYFEYVNQRWLEVMGYNADEVTNLHLFDILREDQIPHCKSMLDELADGGSKNNIRFICITKSGQHLHLEGNVTSRIVNGQFVSTRGIFHDISERIEFESALASSEGRLRATIEAALDGIVSINAMGQIIEFNPAAEAIFGHVATDVMAQDMAELLMPAHYRDQHRAGLQRFLSTSKPKILWQRLELEGLHANGYSFPIELAIVPVSKDDGQAFTAFIRNITERKIAEEKIRQSEALYRGVVDSQTEMVCRYLPDTMTLTFANGAYCNYYELPIDKVIGTRVLDLVSEDEWPELRAHIDYLVSTGATVTSEYQKLTGKGEVRWHQWTDQGISNQQGEVIEIQAVGRDITSIKRAQYELEKALIKEKELSELKSRFVSIASHEFRTPLTTIMSTASFLEVADEQLSTNKRVARLQKIQAASRSMVELLEDVLIFGKADAGHMEFQPEPICLSDFLQQLIYDLQAILPTHQLILEDDIVEKRRYLLDEKLLRQIFTNILTNAVKYSLEANQVRIHLSENKTHLLVQVQDFGIGIPEADQARLFTPFHRAKNTRNIAGTGLGLAITQKAVELHEGAIRFESKTDQGTTFYIEFTKHSA